MRHEERKWISAGIYLQLRVTLNLFLSCLRFSFLCLLFHPKRQFIWKTVTKRRITELPNCFYTIVSLTHSLSLLLASSLASRPLWYCYAHTHAYAREKRNERNFKERITVSMMGTFLTVFFVCTTKIFLCVQDMSVQHGNACDLCDQQHEEKQSSDDYRNGW